MKEESQVETDDCPRCGKRDVMCINRANPGTGIGEDEQLRPMPATKELQYRCLKCDYSWWNPL
jgi:ribosomal protein S27AE